VRIAVIINAHAGSVKARGGHDLRAQLHALIDAAGLEAEIDAPEGKGIAEAGKRAAERAKAGEIDAVVAGGGDGTIRCVAEALAGTGIPFGVLPLGTLNHFAKALGLPLELEDAVAAIAAGVTRKVDVAEVNGRLFLNNSSVGIYPFLVQDRERRQSEHGLTKWIAAFFASFRMLWRFPIRRLSLTVEGETRSHRTPLLFVGNNEYLLELPGLGERERLEAGELWLCVSKAQSRAALFALALRTIFGAGNAVRDLETIRTKSAEIRTRSSRLPVAYDGEVEIMNPPLHYLARPGALIVLTPPSSPVGSNAKN
jgi:diacylglycerol kinase family enzyme